MPANGLKAIQVKALEMLKSDFEKLLERARVKRNKEAEKIEKRMAALSEYSSEDDIMDAYGYASITAKERDTLIDALRKSRAATELALGDKTVLSEYVRMLSNDLRQTNIEIAELREELASAN